MIRIDHKQDTTYIAVNNVASAIVWNVAVCIVILAHVLTLPIMRVMLSFLNVSYVSFVSK